MKQGARGIIFGRNIFLAKRPPALIAALNAVINDGVAPEAALAAHGLEEAVPGAKAPAARRRAGGDAR